MTLISPLPSSEEELRQAMSIVDCDYSRPPSPVPGATQFGALALFTHEERDQINAMHDLISRYVNLTKPPRPLSLAVFGPPGSGKSFAVDQILERLRLVSMKVNLTQASGPRDLSEVLTYAARTPRNESPVIFFDEFDAPRQGAPFGWLSWFLAPMQDGQFLHNGSPVELRRAVYLFAGGTAETMEQFTAFSRLADFQKAKGPDFISRLRGFLDVCGPNVEPRMLRRAVLFRAELGKAIGNSGTTFHPDRELITSLLQAGRYRHGARSIAAVVSLSHLEGKSSFAWNDLPIDHLLELHIDRGPLDAKLIGGSIAFSGYAETKEVEQVWCAVARKLWDEGATLSYGGRWASGPGGWLMKFLEDELRKRPSEPSSDNGYRSKPDPWLQSFLDDTIDEHTNVDAAISRADRDRMGLKVTFAPHLTDEERLGLDRWQQAGLEHFRRRLAITDRSVARFVVAGARTNHFGRFPGIPEEVMLSLAQQKPVYIAGALGGAAEDVGSLLGLAHPRLGAVPSCLKADPEDAEPKLIDLGDRLRPGPWTDLPITAKDLASFLKAHALGGPKWPDNALSFEENRRLYASREPDEVASLVRTGLLRLFAKADPVTPEA
jgi:hypothetical protein